MAVGQKKPKIMMVESERLTASTVQPRTRFDQNKIAELSQSILSHGVLQPLIVRETVGGNYEIIAGERRYRAAKLAGVRKIPCMLMGAAKENALAVALVENIQREDLNPIEEAQAYLRLKKELGLSQEQVALRVGKDRASVANAIRLLRLPGSVQDLVIKEEVSMGHARALLSLDSPDMITMVSKKIVREGLSVRRTESLVRSIKSGNPVYESKKLREELNEQNFVQKAFQQKLEYVLGVRVVLKKEGDGFIVSAHYADENQLNGLLDLLGVEF